MRIYVYFGGHSRAHILYIFFEQIHKIKLSKTQQNSFARISQSLLRGIIYQIALHTSSEPPQLLIIGRVPVTRVA
jgi:hypothetical protein